MKKKGTALATVLIIATALLIIGTAVSAAVINTTKFNARYSDNIDLELAAKSGLNIVREDFLKNVTSVDVIDKYINDGEYITALRNYTDSNYNVNTGIKVNLEVESLEDKVIIKSVAEARSNSESKKSEQQVINLNMQSDVGSENGGENGDLSPLYNTKLSGIFSSNNSFGNEMKYNFNEIYFSDIKKKYNQYKGIGSVITSETNPCDINGEVKLSIPKLNLKSKSEPNEFFINGLKISINGEYQIGDKYSSGNNYKVIMCNGDVTIDCQGKDSINYSNNTIIVANGSVIYKTSTTNNLSMSNIAIMANEIKTQGTFNNISMNSTLTISKKLNLLSSNEISFNPLGDINYNDCIKIIDDIIKNVNIW